MSDKAQARLVTSRQGRAIMHALALLHNPGNWRFYVAGILREVRATGGR